MNLNIQLKSLLASLIVFPAIAHADFVGKVIRISDGDTITVLNAKNQQIRVRFDQIDAPESSQAFGQKAKQNISYLHQTQVYIQEGSKDRYGRTIGTVYQLRNGQVPPLHIKNSVNYKQVSEGYAWAYRGYLKDKEILAAEESASYKRLGLWSASERPIYPSHYRNNK